MRIIAFLLLVLACLGAAEDPADPAAAKIAEQRAEIEELQLELNKKEVEMRGLREHLQMVTEHMALYQLTHIGIARLHAGEGAVGMKTSELYAVVLERLKGLREDVQQRHDYLAAADRLVTYYRGLEEKERKRIEDFQKKKAGEQDLSR